MNWATAITNPTTWSRLHWYQSGDTYYHTDITKTKVWARNWEILEEMIALTTTKVIGECTNSFISFFPSCSDSISASQCLIQGNPDV